MTKDFLSIKDLSKKEIIEIIDFAKQFKSDDGSFRKEDLFPDKTIANIFCEPSTRTKSSFEIAAKNLGCTVIDFDVASSSIQKGESIYETIDALSLMGVDLCVLRHKDSVIRELAPNMQDIIFINAGEGTISHPTQTLIDLMTIKDYKSSLDNLNILIFGDLDHSRVTTSFCEGISKFSSNNITFSGEPSMCTQYQNSNLGKYEPNLDKAIIDADVIMALRIQHERFETDTSLNLDEYKQSFGLTSERLDLARGDVILMHPGPVNFIEISENVYNSDNTVIREQVANGVAIRMAVLSRFLSS